MKLSRAAVIKAVGRRSSEREGGVAMSPRLVPLASTGDGVGRRQLAGVGREAGRCPGRCARHGRRRPRRYGARQLVGVSRHAVQRFRQVGSPLQYYLLHEQHGIL